jgi:hypothetical protein
MSGVTRRILLLIVIVLPLTACGSGSEKQWYKPGGSYTVAEFQRDQATCTRDKVLDEDCLKERGWIAISADEDKGPTPMHGGPPETKRRNAY